MSEVHDGDFAMLPAVPPAKNYSETVRVRVRPIRAETSLAFHSARDSLNKKSLRKTKKIVNLEEREDIVRLSETRRSARLGNDGRRSYADRSSSAELEKDGRARNGSEMSRT